MNKALLFSDLHTSNKMLSKLGDFLNENKISLLIFVGDIVNMGEPVWFAERFIDFLDKYQLPFVWVPGNNDFGRAYHKVNAKYKSVEGRYTKLFEREFTGVGGSPASWEGQYAGEHMQENTKIGGSIFLSHYPPPGVLNYQKFDLPSPTSEKNFSDSPLVHICGHVHHQWGVAYLGQTKVVKLASLETGQFAIMDLDDLSIEFKRFPVSRVISLMEDDQI